MTIETAAETTSPGRTATAQRPGARPRRKKGEGQWALGYREPLNPNEQSKKDDNPLNVRARIENIYASVASLPSIRLTSVVASGGTGSTRSGDLASMAARPPLSSRGSWTMSTSCCASASTAARSPPNNSGS